MKYSASDDSTTWKSRAYRALKNGTIENQITTLTVLAATAVMYGFFAVTYESLLAAVMLGIQMGIVLVMAIGMRHNR